jgi:hypothetical protein
MIDDRCFKSCANLSHVTFESGSKLSSLRDEVFENCPSLSVICVPSHLEAIPQNYQKFVQVITPEIEAVDVADSGDVCGA